MFYLRNRSGQVTSLQLGVSADVLSEEVRSGQVRSGQVGSGQVTPLQLGVALSQ